MELARWMFTGPISNNMIQLSSNKIIFYEHLYLKVCHPRNTHKCNILRFVMSNIYPFQGETVKLFLSGGAATALK